MYLEKIILVFDSNSTRIDDKPFLQKWWVSQRLSSQLMNTPGNQR